MKLPFTVVGISPDAKHSVVCHVVAENAAVAEAFVQGDFQNRGLPLAIVAVFAGEHRNLISQPAG